jgi:hypothetical protein
MRIAVRPCHLVRPHEQGPSRCTRSITSRVEGIVAEGDQHLIENDFVQHLAAALLERFGGASRHAI